MDTRDRDTTVVHTSGGRSGASWFLAGIVVVALIVAAFFLLGDFGGERQVDVNVQAPAVEAPAAPAAPEAPAAPAAPEAAAPADGQ